MKAIFRKLVMRQLIAMLLCTPLLLFANEPQVLGWAQLVPEGWNPNSVFDKYTDEEFSSMSDEQYFVLQEQARVLLEAAPTVDALDGELVRIPGYMLPLEFDEANIKEFLLVPYFGACVHTPPPPANQIIHGKLESAFATNELFSPVWISGKLKTIRTKNRLGETGISQSLDVETGYTMEVLEVEPYQE